MGKHFPLGIQDADIDCWLVHFSAITEHLEPGLAEQWALMAEGIAARLRQIVVHHQMR